MLSDQDFQVAAAKALGALTHALAKFDPDELDLDEGPGVLTLTFADRSKCVINRQSAAHQLWMAADANAWHFARTEQGTWVDTRDRGDLLTILGGLISHKLGRKVALSE